MNVRPHPGLLPQEKENRSPRFGDADGLGCRAAFSTNDEAAAMTRRASKHSSDADSPTLSPGERAGVRASVKTILCSTLLFCFAFVSPLLADEVITNVMSPVVSYQYQEDFSSAGVLSSIVSYQYFNAIGESGTAIVSPIVSYQYFDWPGDDVLQLTSSPWVSYFYHGNDTMPIVLQGRVTNPDGVPLASAAISIAFGTLPLTGTNTDASGNFAIPLGAGVYAVTASASGHAKSSRVLALNVGTATQNFQLASLPTAPSQQDVNRSPTVNYAVGQMGELKVFDGANFVSIINGNTPQLDRMTIVMTHGFDSNPEAWAKGMAAQMQAQGVTLDVANILCWDWREAAEGPLTPDNLSRAYGCTGEQGIGLGRALQTHLGVGYFEELHFLGHSLGTLVNATAVNFLRGDKLGHEDVASVLWISKPIHVTLFDHAEMANLLNQDLLYDGFSINKVEAVERIASGANYTMDWRRSMPVRPTWADNYMSAVGFEHSKAVNIKLQKSATELSVVNPHSYAWWWYSNSVANPTHALNPLGFQRSYEYVRAVGLPNSTFPPSSAEFSLGSRYEQTPWSSDPLALQRDLTIRETIGILAQTVVQGTVIAAQTVGNVTMQIRDGAQAAGQWIAGGFNYVGSRALQGEQSLINVFDSAVLRLQLQTSPPQSLNLRSLTSGGSPPMNIGDPTQPMAWLPIQFPASATAMAFDFIVEGNPVNDLLVCGIGTNNLFSVEAKFIPTNTISASRLIDVSAWAGTTNELFFGFLGGTSTNATLIIENIRFYSLEQPKLEIARSGNGTLLSWPLTTSGYVVETTPMLTVPTWETVTNAPVISAGRYVLTNSWSAQSRFFRLRQQ